MNKLRLANQIAMNSNNPVCDRVIISDKEADDLVQRIAFRSHVIAMRENIPISADDLCYAYQAPMIPAHGITPGLHRNLKDVDQFVATLDQLERKTWVYLVISAIAPFYTYNLATSIKRANAGTERHTWVTERVSAFGTLPGYGTLQQIIDEECGKLQLHLFNQSELDTLIPERGETIYQCLFFAN